MHCRVLSSVPGLYPPDARINLLLSCDGQKCLQHCPVSLGGQSCLPSHPLMPKKQGGTSSITEDSKRWRGAAKNNDLPTKDHKSQQRQLPHPDDAICFQGGAGGRAGRDIARAGRHETRWGGRLVWKAEMPRQYCLGLGSDPEADPVVN